MRGGDFSALLPIDAVRYQVYDPASTRRDPSRAGHWVRTPFAGNVLPRARMTNPIYSTYTRMMPVANNDPHRSAPRARQQLPRHGHAE